MERIPGSQVLFLHRKGDCWQRASNCVAYSGKKSPPVIAKTQHNFNLRSFHCSNDTLHIINMAVCNQVGTLWGCQLLRIKQLWIGGCRQWSSSIPAAYPILPCRLPRVHLRLLRQADSIPSTCCDKGFADDSHRRECPGSEAEAIAVQNRTRLKLRLIATTKLF